MVKLMITMLMYVDNFLASLKYYLFIEVSEIGAVVKVIDSHLCGCGSIPGKSCTFLSHQELIPCFLIGM